MWIRNKHLLITAEILQAVVVFLNTFLDYFLFVFSSLTIFTASDPVTRFPNVSSASVQVPFDSSHIFNLTRVSGDQLRKLKKKVFVYTC